jgi:hypothetical protein
MAQVDTHHPLTAEAQFDPRPVYVGFVVDSVAMKWDTLRVLQLSSVRIIPPNLHAHISFTYHRRYIILPTYSIANQHNSKTHT